MSPAPSRIPRCLWVPALAGGALRAVHLLFLALRDPLFSVPVVDAFFHSSQARAILAKGWLLPGSGAFYKGPLYSYLLAVLYAVFGESAGVAAARLLSLIAGSLSIFLVARIARSFGGDRAAWVAGICAAVYGTAIYFDVTLLLTPLVTLFLLWAADRLLTAADSPELPLAAAGALLGLVTITRANGLLVVVAAAGWAAWQARSGRWPGLPAWRAAALLLVPAVLVISPVTLRNTFLEHDPVIVSWNGGINLFMGNDPGFDQGSGNWHPDLTWTRLNEAPSRLGLPRGGDHQRFFVRQTLLRARDQPLTTLRILARKAALLFTAYEISNNRRIDGLASLSPLLRPLLAHGRWFALPLTVIGPLLAMGLWFAWRERIRGGSAVWVLAAAWAITPVLFFNTARYRLPAIFLLLPLAAAGWVQARSRGRLAGGLVTGGILGVFVLLASSLTIPSDPMLPPSDFVLLGEVATSRGHKDAAREAFRQAWEAEPHNPFAEIRHADSLLSKGEFASALEIYRAVMADQKLDTDWHHAALRSSARCLAGLGRFDESIAAYRRFLADDPDRPVTRGRPDFHLRQVPPLVSCEYRGELADVLVAAGRPEEAVAELVRVTTDCAEAEPMVRKAQKALRLLAIDEGGAASSGGGVR